MLNSQYFEKR